MVTKRAKVSAARLEYCRVFWGCSVAQVKPCVSIWRLSSQEMDMGRVELEEGDVWQDPSVLEFHPLSRLTTSCSAWPLSGGSSKPRTQDCRADRIAVVETWLFWCPESSAALSLWLRASQATPTSGKSLAWAWPAAPSPPLCSWLLCWEAGLCHLFGPGAAQADSATRCHTAQPLGAALLGSWGHVQCGHHLAQGCNERAKQGQHKQWGHSSKPIVFPWPAGFSLLVSRLWKTLGFSHTGSHVSPGLWLPSCSWTVAGWYLLWPPHLVHLAQLLASDIPALHGCNSYWLVSEFTWRA